MDKLELATKIHKIVNEPIGMYEEMYKNDPKFREFVEANKDKSLAQMRENYKELLVEIGHNLEVDL